MQERLLEILACPDDQEPLALVPFERAPDLEGHPPEPAQIAEGLLVCPRGHRYPLTGGIPRLLPGPLDLFPAFAARWKERLRGNRSDDGLAPAPLPASSGGSISTLHRFQLQWERHDLEGRTWGLQQADRLEHFVRYLDVPRVELVGKRVLDAGCGTGQQACTYASLGCEVVAVDLSPALERGWSLRRGLPADQAARIHMVQGDLQRPPFRDESFDVVHSSGVLHHTPDTRQTLASLVRLVRCGGVCAVWLYKPAPDARLPLVPGVKARWLAVSQRGLRRFTPRLPPALLYAALYAYTACFHGAFALNRVLRGRPHDQSIRERVTSLFDYLAPPFRWTHEPAEVSRWLADLGFIEVRDTSLPNDPYGFSIRGVRSRPSIRASAG